jgi:hypothetical protein
MPAKEHILIETKIALTFAKKKKEKKWREGRS